MRILQIIRELSFADYILIFKIHFFLYLSKWYIENRNLKEIVKWVKLDEGVEKRPLSLEEKRFAAKLAQFTQTLSKFVLYKSKCYDQALTVKKILNKESIPSTLSMGVKISEEDEMKAHAWIKCGDWIVIGGSITNGYTPLGNFY